MTHSLPAAALAASPGTTGAGAVSALFVLVIWCVIVTLAWAITQLQDRFDLPQFLDAAKLLLPSGFRSHERTYRQLIKGLRDACNSVAVAMPSGRKLLAARVTFTLHRDDYDTIVSVVDPNDLASDLALRLVQVAAKQGWECQSSDQSVSIDNNEGTPEGAIHVRLTRTAPAS